MPPIGCRALPVPHELGRARRSLPGPGDALDPPSAPPYAKIRRSAYKSLRRQRSVPAIRALLEDLDRYGIDVEALSTHIPDLVKALFVVTVHKAGAAAEVGR